MLWKTFLRVAAPFGILTPGLFAWAQLPYPNPISYLTPTDLITAILSYLRLIAIPLAVVALLVAGIYFVIASARGNEGQLRTAKTLLWWAVIGVILVVGAWAISTALVETIKKL